MRYHATIRRTDGGVEKRIIEGASRFAVYEQVQREGGAVTQINEAGRGLHMPTWLNLTFGSGIKHRVVIQFAKNIATMLNAGLSLSRALSIIERQASNKRLKAVAVGISEAIRKGSSLHEALEQYPRVFSGLFVAMTRAGEESGTLADSFSVTALQMERTEELRKKVRGAMIYPSIVIVAIVVVTILMLIFVVPTLTATFTSLGVKLPLATRIIVDISDFMTTHMVLVLLGLIALAIGITAFVRSNFGKNAITVVALRLPVIGELVRETYAARTARTLASLMSAGVPVLSALSITKETATARRFASVIAEAEVRIKKGEALSAAFAGHPKLYPILMSDMIEVGEETGKAAEMLKQIAEYYETDVAEKTKDLSTIIEPVLMLLIGAMVGVFAVSIIAPIYSLSSAI